MTSVVEGFVSVILSVAKDLTILVNNFLQNSEKVINFASGFVEGEFV